MAAKKKTKAAKKPAKKTKRPAKAAARKAVSRKAAPKAASAKKAKPKAKKSLFAKAVSTVTKLIAPKKKPASREFGEGNYKASKNFRDGEEAYIKKNRAKIPALAKAAEDALDGPEGDELRAAEESTAAHAAGQPKDE